MLRQNWKLKELRLLLNNLLWMMIPINIWIQVFMGIFLVFLPAAVDYHSGEIFLLYGKQRFVSDLIMN